ncbi:MAG: hypothetical protein AMXMBFR84_18790 [Candidatus Hydrogenedentota bacterium]
MRFSGRFAIFAVIGLVALAIGVSAFRKAPEDEKTESDFLSDIREGKIQGAPGSTSEGALSGGEYSGPIIDPTVLDMGTISHLEPTTKTLMVTNRGKRDMEVEFVQPMCPCTYAEIKVKRTNQAGLEVGVFKAGSSTPMDVTVYPDRVSSFESDVELILHSPDVDGRQMSMRVKSKIDPEFEFEPAEFNFGPVRLTEPKEIKLTIRQTGEHLYDVLSMKPGKLGSLAGDAAVMSGDTWYTASFEPAPKESWRDPNYAEWIATVTLLPGAHSGPLTDNLELDTTAPRFKPLLMPIQATILP